MKIGSDYMGLAEYVFLVGFVMIVIGLWKIKFGGEFFKGCLIMIIGLSICVLTDRSTYEDKPEPTHKPSKITQEVKQEFKEQVAEEIIDRMDDGTPTNKPTSSVIPTGSNWIKDSRDVYLWNPEPQDGESITWSGGFVQDGDYKFADGSGVVTWYFDGRVIQVDKGTFRHGQRQGRFSHEFPSGRVDYSNWNNGVEIP